jgi:hypothetical protein
LGSLASIGPRCTAYQPASLVGSAALLVCEARVVAKAGLEAVQAPSISPTFVDDRLPLRPWFQVNDLDDLNSHLVGSVIAVLTPYLAVKVKH